MTTFFGATADRVNMVHPAYADGTTGNPHPMGVFAASKGDFVNTWIPGGSSTVPNNFLTLGATTTGPDGVAGSAQKLVEAATNQTHSIVGGVLLQSSVSQWGCNFRLAVFLKAAERTRAVLSLQNSTFNQYNGGGTAQFPGVAGIQAVFDLAGGTVAVASASFGAGVDVGGPATITAFGNGWYRCTIDGVAGIWYQSGPGPLLAYVYIDNGSGSAAQSTTYAGNGTSGIYAWKGNCLPVDAYAMTKQVYFDDFTTTNSIDINNTKQPGFSWYVTNNWPKWNAGQFLPLVYGVSNDYDLATPSILSCHCQQSTATVFNAPNYLFTACFDGGSSYIGNSFAMPALFECRTAWGTPPNPWPAGPNNGGVWPAFWSAQPSAMAIPHSSTAPLQWEVDFAEGTPEFASPSLNNASWTFFDQNRVFTQAVGELKALPSSFSYPSGVVADPDFTQFHIYSTMILGRKAGPLPITSGQHNILPNTSFAGAVGGSPGTPPNRMTFDGLPITNMTLTTALSNEVYSIRTQSAGGMTGQNTFHLNLNVSPINSANGTIGPNQIWTGSIYLRVAAGTPDVTWSKLLNIREYDTSGTLLAGTNNVAVQVGFGDATLFQRTTIVYRTQVSTCARLALFLTFSTFAAGPFDVTFEIKQPQLEQSSLPTIFQPSTGSDTQGVLGVSFANSQSYWLRNFLFFDTSGFSDAIYFSPDLNLANGGGKIETDPSIKLMAIISVTPTFWTTQYDWVSVMGAGTLQPAPALPNLTIQDRSSATRLTQANDVSGVGAGPWEAARTTLDGSGVLEASVTNSLTSTNALQVSPITGATRELPSSTSTNLSVASSALSFTLLDVNTNRLSANIFNDSTQVLYLLLSAPTEPKQENLIPASTTLYTVQVKAGTNYEIPANYTGLVQGFWASANGFARITEITG